MDKIKIGIVSVSDRASKGIYEDKGIEAVRIVINEYIENEVEFFERLIPDEEEEVRDTLIELSDNENCSLILTTGGTGPTIRDVTVEATISVGEKVLPGFGEAMRMASLQIVPTAILSRQVAVIRHTSLIINLPGKPKAVRECMDVVFGAIPDCINIIGGPRIKTNEEILKAQFFHN